MKPELLPRAAAIWEARQAGWTLRKIGQGVGLTNERVRGILRQYAAYLAKRETHQRAVTAFGFIPKQPPPPPRPNNHPDFGAQDWTPEQQAREFGLI